jgi:hypothetical protein
MNYYESKMLQDRESHLIGAGISFILMSPLFGIVAGVFILSAIAMYVTIGLVALLGVLTIAAGIKEKVDRNRNQSS